MPQYAGKLLGRVRSGAGRSDARRQASPEASVIGVAVSVVIPVYNAERYIEETVRSALKQALPVDQLEVIAVNDGSTDSSAAVLDRLAAEDQRIVVIHQENSGGPSAPRNAALERAAGRYVFFLDSDDVLAPDALARMVEIADREASDVVLGRFGSLNGRHIPDQMFRRTVMDADVIETNAWDSLGPIKLFRRTLIESLSLRFSEDQWIGEDQPFTAAMYLNAAKVTILADGVYCYIRKRDDGQNITSRQQTLSDKAKTTTRLAAVVAQYTMPGPKRDRLIRRVFTSTLPSALAKLWLEASQDERRLFIAAAQEGLAPYYTEGVEKYCTIVGRIKNDLLMRGEADALVALAEHEASGRRVTCSISEGRVKVDLPVSVEELVPERLRADVEVPPITHKLTDLYAFDSGFLVAGYAGFSGIETAPDSVRAVLVNRDSADEVMLTTRLMGSQKVGNTEVREFSVETNVLSAIGSIGAASGAWGIFLDVEHQGVTRRTRFGKHNNAVPDSKVGINATSPVNIKRSVIAYFNAGYRNLTFDVNGTVHKGAIAGDVIGMRHDGNGETSWLSILVRISPAPSTPPTFSTINGSTLASQRFSLNIFEATYPLGEGTSVVGLQMNDGSIEHALELPTPTWIDDEDLVISSNAEGRMAMRVMQHPSNRDSASAPQKLDQALNVYWWDGKPNFGDAIGPWLVELITDKPVVNTKGKRHIGNTLVTVGSLLNYLDRGGLDVWGTGLIAPMGEETVRRLAERKPRRIHAVRGQKTYDELTQKLGWDVPKVFGDPALLLPRFYTPSETQETGHIAVCPHYAHKGHFHTASPSAVKFIDVASAPSAVIDDIASASVCISTSLHGVIIAQAYGVPWVWLHIIDKPLMGDEFKFEDFFSVIDSSAVARVSVRADEVRTLDWEAVAREASLPRSLTNFDDLLEAFPETW